MFLHTLIWVRGTSGVGQMCRDRESGILVIFLMVDLRVVDILGVVEPARARYMDVIHDMD